MFKNLQLNKDQIMFTRTRKRGNVMQMHRMAATNKNEIKPCNGTKTCKTRKTAKGGNQQK
jgi:hypothetical protein